MEITRTILFDAEKDKMILTAVGKSLGKQSLSSHIDDGLTEAEAKLCNKFYAIIMKLID